MPSKYTLGSAGLLGVVTVTQAMAGDWPTAIMSGAALATGSIGYTRDKTLLGKLTGGAKKRLGRLRGR